MSDYLYKTVPMRRTLAPKRQRGQSAEEAIATAVGNILEEQAQDGWEFYRSDVFVAPTKIGWLSREQNAEFNILTFRKGRSSAALTEDESGWREPPSDYNYNDPYVDPALRRGAVAATGGGVVRRRAAYPPSAGYDMEPEPTPTPAPVPAAPPKPQASPKPQPSSEPQQSPEPRRAAPPPRPMRGGERQSPQPQQLTPAPVGEHTRTADKLRSRARAARGQSSIDLEAKPNNKPDNRPNKPTSVRTVIDDTISLSASMRMRSDQDD